MEIGSVVFVPEYQRNSERLSVLLRSLWSCVSSLSWSRYSSTCVGGICCTLSEPAVQRTGFVFSSSELFNVHFSLKSSAAAARVKQYISGSTYFLLKQAVEDEDKHALERVKDGEEVRQDNGWLAGEEQAKWPGQAQETQQNKAAHDPRPSRANQTETTSHERGTFPSAKSRNHHSITIAAKQYKSNTGSENNLVWHLSHK